MPFGRVGMKHGLVRPGDADVKDTRLEMVDPDDRMET
jgi:hypothetical protein